MIMKKIYMVLVFMLLLSLSLGTTAFASSDTPAGRCAPGFELHMMEHFGEHHHPHIGVDRDLNGDGSICMKSLPSNMHLIVDNSVPLP